MKNFTLLLLFCSIATGVFAQDKFFRVGPIIGMEVTSSSAEPWPRGHFGIATNFSFSEKMGLQAEIIAQSRDLLYSSLGIPSKWEDTSANYGYILVPLMFEFKPFDNAISFQAGPRFGFKAWEAIKYGETDFSSLYYDVNDSFEIGFLAGAQYVTKFRMFASIRGGFSHTTSSSGGVVALSLGFLF